MAMRPFSTYLTIKKEMLLTTIIFGMLGETIELRVAASNRDCYALGAIEAAIWLAGKPAGKYNMYDVLGL